MRIERGYTALGTFGEFYDNDGNFVCYTVERPWANNEPFQSCVPEGQYLVEEHDFNNHGTSFCLVGRGVSVYQTADCERYAIVFHVENWPYKLEGCIAPASGLGILSDQWAGLKSGNALAQRLVPVLDQAIETGTNTLDIVGKRAL